MADPLSLLRDFVKAKKPVYLDGDEFVFGDLRYPRKTEVQFKEKKIPLEAVWFFLKNINIPYHGEYIIAARNARFPFISFIDRKPLLQYLGVEGTDWKPEHLEAGQPSSFERPAREEPEREAKRTRFEDESTEQKQKADESTLQKSVDYLPGLESTREKEEMLQKAKQEWEHIVESVLENHGNSNNNEDDKINLDAVRPFIEADAQALQKLLKREKPFVTRNTVTQIQFSSNKPHFSTNGSKAPGAASTSAAAINKGPAATESPFASIIPLLAEIKKEEAVRRKMEAAAKDKKKQTAAVNVSASKGKSFDAKTTWKSHLGGEANVLDEYGIDPMGSNIIAGLGSGSNIKLAIEQSVQQSTTNEKEGAEAEGNAPAAPAPTTSTSTQGNQQQQQQPHRKSESHKRKAEHISKSHADKQRKRKPPIIIVPPSKTSIITLYNARDFLQNGSFIPSEDKRKENAKKENPLVIKREDGKEFHVIDNPADLPRGEWDRVVAIISNGQEWEFKGWAVGSNPTEILSKYKGFHFKFDDEKVNPNIAKWPVKVLQISKAEHKRHLDKPTVNEFWVAVYNVLNAKQQQ